MPAPLRKCRPLSEGEAVTAPRPMLANLFNPASPDHQNAKLCWICEEKLNGMRAMIVLEPNDRPRLYTRRISSVSGLVVEKSEHLLWLPDIRCPSRRLTLDGELIMPGGTVQDVMQVMGCLPEEAQERQRAGQEVAYRCFDILETRGQDLRIWGQKSRSREAAATCLEIDHWAVQPVLAMREGEDADAFAKMIWAEGGEGVMLKNPWMPYVEGKRPANTWLKLKKSQTFCGLVTDIKEGTGKYRGMMGSVRVKEVDGELECDVGTGFTDQERNLPWVGQKIMVEYMDLSHDGVPLLPRRKR